MRHAHDALDHRQRSFGLLQVAQERLVDFERIHGQLAQIAERRIAGAKIVDRDADAELADLGEARGRLREILHDVAFGQLQLQPVGRQISQCQRVGHGFHEIAPFKLQCRHVDRNAGGAVTGFVPAGSFETGPADHPRSDIDDQTGFLGDRDELLGRDGPVDGMPPGEQRLQALHLPVHADHGLIKQLEFLMFQRAAQRVFQAQALQAGGVVLGPENLHLVLAAILGVIHRQVRVAQQFGDSFAMPGINGDSDAGRDEQLIVFNLVRRAQGDQELARG